MAESNLGKEFLGAVAVPNVDVLVTQQVGVGSAGNEPDCTCAAATKSGWCKHPRKILS